jgi:hypothetical protein
VTFTATGKQVFEGRAHFADAVSVEAAQRIVRAMNRTSRPTLRPNYEKGPAYTRG